MKESNFYGEGVRSRIYIHLLMMIIEKNKNDHCMCLHLLCYYSLQRCEILFRYKKKWQYNRYAVTYHAIRLKIVFAWLSSSKVHMRTYIPLVYSLSLSGNFFWISFIHLFFFFLLCFLFVFFIFFQGFYFTIPRRRCDYSFVRLVVVLMWMKSVVFARNSLLLSELRILNI